MNKLGAAGTSPPCVVLAGGGAASEPRRSNKRAAPWDAATIARVRQMAADGMSSPDAAAAMGVPKCMMRYRAGLLGIKFNSLSAVATAFAKAADVLREHWGVNPDSADIYRRYTEALGRQCPKQKMHHHAHRVGATRCAEALATRGKLGVAARLAQSAGVRAVKAVKLQELLNLGVRRTVAGLMLGYGDKSIQRMLTDGLITVPARAIKVKPPKPPRAVAAKPSKPRPLPASYTRAPTPPPAPKVYQTVAEWLASGHTVTRCPAAMAEETQATTSDADRAAWRAIHDKRDAERMAAGDAWRQKSHRKNRRIAA